MLCRWDSLVFITYLFFFILNIKTVQTYYNDLLWLTSIHYIICVLHVCFLALIGQIMVYCNDNLLSFLTAWSRMQWLGMFFMLNPNVKLTMCHWYKSLLINMLSTGALYKHQGSGISKVIWVNIIVVCITNKWKKCVLHRHIKEWVSAKETQIHCRFNRVTTLVH